jgi:zinc transporter 9
LANPRSTSKIALSLLMGFAFMLVVEEAHSHSPSQPGNPLEDTIGECDSTNIEFDAELGELEREHVVNESSPRLHRDLPSCVDTGSQKLANPLTIGLLVHGLADGLALGVSTLSTKSGVPSGLSLAVFFALIIHKGV